MCIRDRPIGFDAPAKYTKSDYFVIEADEYDTSFFDKRSKFMHYRPWIFVINNIEFDHADIFDDTESIIRSFHHVVRIIPNNECDKCRCNTYKRNRKVFDFTFKKDSKEKYAN